MSSASVLLSSCVCVCGFVTQGYGKELWQAFGKFKGNGGCGYVLKPQYLLENLPSGVPFNPTSPRNTTLILKVNFPCPVAGPGYQ